MVKWLIGIVLSWFIFAGCAASPTQAELPPPEKPAEQPLTEQDRVETLIKQLGDDDWATREKAQQRLIQLGEMLDIKPVLQKYENRPDLEVRLRISRILAKLNKKSDDWASIIEANPDVNEARILLIYDESCDGSTRIEIRLAETQKVIPDIGSLEKEVKDISAICTGKKIDILFIIDSEPKIPVLSVINTLNACKKAGIKEIHFAPKSK
jgi:hypothetical protein